MEYVEKTAKDYSKCCDIDMDSKLKPINKSVDEMLARLEEFQTMMSFVVQDRKDYNDILTSVPKYREEFDTLCNKIDSVEKLTSHIKCNLDELENEIEKSELSLGCTEKTTKVTQMFTPLFLCKQTDIFDHLICYRKRMWTKNNLPKVQNYLELRIILSNSGL